MHTRPPSPLNLVMQKSPGSALAQAEDAGTELRDVLAQLLHALRQIVRHLAPLEALEHLLAADVRGWGAQQVLRDTAPITPPRACEPRVSTCARGGVIGVIGQGCNERTA